MYLPDPAGSFELAPEGTHAALCFRFVDLGTQYSEFYAKSAPKIQIFWELPTELMNDGRPFTVSKRYTLSMHPVKALLRKDLEAWRGLKFVQTDFDRVNPKRFKFENLIGAACQVTVMHTESGGKTYDNVASVAGWPKGMPKPTMTNTPSFFSLSDFDADAFEAQPEWLRETIKKAPEYVALTAPKSSVNGSHAPLGAPLSAELSDEIPF